jgi:SAM-dependent methyltransferase
LAELQRVAQEQGITNIQTLAFDGTTIPAADASFDLAYSFEVVEHVEDERRTLQEIHRVLKADGEFLITVPNKWWVFETHGARLPLLPWNRVPFFSWLPSPLHSRWAHARIYRRSRILRLLDQEGFTVLGDAYVTAPMDVLPVPALQRFLRRTVFRTDATHIPFLATAIMVHCRRRNAP